MPSRRRSDALLVIGTLVLCLPFALYAVLAWVPIVFWLWHLPAWGWQVLVTLLVGGGALLRVPRPGSRAPLPHPPPRERLPSPAWTPAQHARYHDMQAKGWSELASRQAAERLASPRLVIARQRPRV